MLNLAACPLCILQRMLYLLLAAVGVLGLLVSRPLPRRLAAFAMATVAAPAPSSPPIRSGSRTSRARPTASPTRRGGNNWSNWASERVPLLFQVSGLCSEPGWKLFGVTIAEWSLLAFTGLFALAMFAFLRRR